MPAKVRYTVEWDADEGVWFATRNGKRGWNTYQSYKLNGAGIGEPTPVAPEAPDTVAGKAELVDVVLGEARHERNRSSLRPGRGYTGYACPVVVFDKNGKVEKRYPVKKITSCSMAPFR